MVFTRFLGHCLLLPTFWPQNLISTSTNPNTSVTQIGWNYLHLSLRSGVHKVFAVILTFDLLTPNLISTSMNPNTSVTKMGWNSLHWYLRYGVHKIFLMHRLTYSFTHSQMDRPEYSMRLAPFLNGGRHNNGSIYGQQMNCSNTRKHSLSNELFYIISLMNNLLSAAGSQLLILASLWWSAIMTQICSGH